MEFLVVTDRSKLLRKIQDLEIVLVVNQEEEPMNGWNGKTTKEKLWTNCSANKYYIIAKMEQTGLPRLLHFMLLEVLGLHQTKILLEECFQFINNRLLLLGYYQEFFRQFLRLSPIRRF